MINPVQLNFVIPPLRGRDPRVLGVLEVLEDFFPGLNLSWMLVKKEGEAQTDTAEWGAPGQYRLVKVPDRQGYVERSLEAMTPIHLYNTPDQFPVSVAMNPASRFRVRDGRDFGDVSVWLPEECLEGDALTRLVPRCGDVLRAWYMAFMPFAAGRILTEWLYTGALSDYRGAAGLPEHLSGLKDLPRLRSASDQLPSPEIPSTVGWLNYWSSDTARVLGFPDMARDNEWLEKCTATTSGGWLLKLTDEPFDVWRPDHISVLVRAYRRFDRVGARS